MTNPHDKAIEAAVKSAKEWIDDAPDPDPVVFRPLPPAPEGE